MKNCFALASTSAAVSVVRYSWSVRWDWFMTTLSWWRGLALDRSAATVRRRISRVPEA
jgi:hypothetical protein